MATAAVVALVLLASCGGGDDAGSVAAPEEPVTAITITSPGLSFDIKAFQVPVGEEVTVTYENEHQGVQHNIHIDTGGDDEPQTEVVKGVVTQELTFTIDEPGEHTYICDVHPAQMRGKVTAVAAG